MIDRDKLEQLKSAAARGDWSLAGDLYVELSHTARNATTRQRIESLAWALRLRDYAALVVLAERLARGS